MILLIDNYDSFTHNLYQALAQNGVPVCIHRNDAISVKDIAALNPTAIVISPGPGRPEEAGNCIDIVKQFFHAIPMLGVCLGHQVIVSAFGGKVELADQPVHGQSTLVFHHRQALYHNCALPFKAARYHSLVALRKTLPEILVVESENEEGMVMGVRHRDFPVFGLQFHPESILTEAGQQIINNFIVLSCMQKEEQKSAAI